MNQILDLDALSGADAVRRVVAAVDAGDLSIESAVMSVAPGQINEILHRQFSTGDCQPIASGLGASPGAAVGRVYFSADAAEDAYDRGEDVILVQNETSPADVGGMEVAEGILTTRGGISSHAAVVARGWGKPAVCGVAEIQLGDGRFTVGDVVVLEGDVISLDGASGQVFVGAVGTSDDDVPAELGQLLSWADEIRADHLAVRANADNAADAAKAREFGAEGIGLCRTEHQFLGTRLPLMRAMLLAADEEASTAALSALGESQRSDFESLLEAMDGLPVTVRLLDPPLHEFLPPLAEMIAADAAGTLDDDERAMLSVAREWAEVNPMLGTRGVRLGLLKPELYRTQVRALLTAAVARREAGGDPIIEVMVPLIVNRAELDMVRTWIDDEIARANAGLDQPLDVMVGSMIETPRAAVVAQSIAPAADFFSFGTNDLTQMTFGFSRDDVESRIMTTYIEQGLLPSNPFETIDRDGVGQLVIHASAAARKGNPGIKLGVCGEHGGDPASISLFFEAGMDYVSCSPFRVPLARLAAAQAVLADRAVD